LREITGGRSHYPSRKRKGAARTAEPLATQADPLGTARMACHESGRTGEPSVRDALEVAPDAVAGAARWGDVIIANYCDYYC
jgi:hypothetical protein